MTTGAAVPDAVPVRPDAETEVAFAVPAVFGTALEPPTAEEDMSPAARAARVAWRRAHPDAWRRELAEMGHDDPEFVYEPEHEYEWEWTTDPDYLADGVALYEYDADGKLLMMERRAPKLQEAAATTLRDALPEAGPAVAGCEADTEILVRCQPADIAWVNDRTDWRHPVTKGVKPDMLVLPAMSDADRARWFVMDDRGTESLRLDRGAPPPPLVLEVVSENSAQRDLEYKKTLYAVVGVREYWIYDLGGKRSAHSPRELLVYRLGDDGTYLQVAPVPGTGGDTEGPTADVPEYESAVLGTRIRFQADAREFEPDMLALPLSRRPPPRLQWWDRIRTCWRDHETDTERERDRLLQEREARGEARGIDIGRAAERLATATALLPILLGDVLEPAVRTRIADHWRAVGVPNHYLEYLAAVQRNPDAWQSLLGIPADPPLPAPSGAQAPSEGRG